MSNNKADFTNDRKQQRDVSFDSNSQDSPEKVQSKRSKPNSELSDKIDVVTLPSTDETNKEQNSQDGKLPLWVAGSSPAKFLTLEELVKISNSIEKMTLVHEMAVDPTFNAQRAQKKDELYEFVKDNVHRAYWDTLEEDMTKDPPDYTFAFQMLKDLNSILKRQFDALNLQNVLSLINEILDMEKLETQYKNKHLDFHKVLRLILDVLRRLCAPAYDEMVQQLNTEENLAKLFSGTFKLVDYMEKDVISIIITQNRKAIMKYSAEYERDKFMEALKVDPKGAYYTQLWLKYILSKSLAKRDGASTSSSSLCANTSDTMTSSSGLKDDEKASSILSKVQIRDFIVDFYMAIVEMKPTIDDDEEGMPPADLRVHFPETLILDKHRLLALGEKYLQLELVTAAIFITGNLAGKRVCETPKFKTTLKTELIVILNDVSWRNYVNKLENVFLQCEKNLNGGQCWTEDKSILLKAQILELKDRNNSIRIIARDRIRSFLQLVLRGDKHIQLPPGLTSIQPELIAFTKMLYDILVHNWQTFGDFYAELLQHAYHEKVAWMH